MTKAQYQKLRGPERPKKYLKYFSSTLFFKGLECRALQTLGDFPASHPMPYIFMEWKELVASPRRCFIVIISSVNIIISVSDIKKQIPRCPNLVGFIDLMEAQGYSPR